MESDDNGFGKMFDKFMKRRDRTGKSTDSQLAPLASCSNPHQPHHPHHSHSLNMSYPDPKHLRIGTGFNRGRQVPIGHKGVSANNIRLQHENSQHDHSIHPLYRNGEVSVPHPPVLHRPKVCRQPSDQSQISHGPSRASNSNVGLMSPDSRHKSGNYRVSQQDISPPKEPTHAVPVFTADPAISKRFPCKQCSSAFDQKRKLGRHIRVVHEKLMVCSCDKCGKPLSDRRELKRHCSFVHEDVRRFSCDSCEYRSHTKGHLNVHVRTVHQRQKRFNCDQCGLPFGVRSALLRHVRAVHDRERQWTCEYCFRAFSRKDSISATLVESTVTLPDIVILTGKEGRIKNLWLFVQSQSWA